MNKDLLMILMNLCTSYEPKAVTNGFVIETTQDPVCIKEGIDENPSTSGAISDLQNRYDLCKKSGKDKGQQLRDCMIEKK